MSQVYVKRLCALPSSNHSSAFVSSQRSGEEGEVGVMDDGWSRFVVFVFCSSDLSESAASALRTKSE